MSNEIVKIIRPKTEVRAIRMNQQQQGDVLFTRKLLINVLYWTEFSGDKFAEPVIKNKGNRVSLTLNILRDKKGKRLKQVLPMTFCQVLQKEKGKNDFEFNSEIRNLLEVVVNDGKRPDSTKKAIVTYEDTDIIENSDKTESL